MVDRKLILVAPYVWRSADKRQKWRDLEAYLRKLHSLMNVELLFTASGFEERKANKRKDK